jgi:hypothetical protein
VKWVEIDQKIMLSHKNHTRYASSSWTVGLLVAAAMCGFLTVKTWKSEDTNESVLSPALTEAQQEENDVQAMEAKYLAKEKADDKAELISFDQVQKMSKAARHKRPLWGKRKWPTYYHNVLGGKDVFTADEPKHPLRNLDVGDDDLSIEAKARARGSSNHRRRRSHSHSRGDHSNRTPQHALRGHVQRKMKSVPTQDLAELRVLESPLPFRAASHRPLSCMCLPRTFAFSIQPF